MKFTYLKFKKEDFWFLFICFQCFLGKSANLRLRKLRTTFGYGLKVERYKGKMKTLVALPALPGPKISKNTFKSFNSWHADSWNAPLPPLLWILELGTAPAHTSLSTANQIFELSKIDYSISLPILIIEISIGRLQWNFHFRWNHCGRCVMQPL
jgi:hypothetical protein